MGYIEYYGHRIYYNEDLQDCLTESEKASGAIALDYTPDWEYMKRNPIVEPTDKNLPPPGPTRDMIKAGII